jgi:predicted amino acid-binding ACT domain protein
MSLQVTAVDVWQGQVPDTPGTLGQALDALAKAGADLDFGLARRDYEAPGNSIVFISPLKGVRQIAAAEAVGFHRSTKLHAVRVTGSDRPGVAGEVAAALGAAGVNIRGFSGTVLEKQVIIHVSVDSKEDSTKAVQAIRKIS